MKDVIKQVSGFILFVIVMFYFMGNVVFDLQLISPHSSDVSDFLKKDSLCSLAKDFDDEHWCIYYLRRHSTNLFGNIVSVPIKPLFFIPNFFLYINTPFKYYTVFGNATDGMDDHAYTTVLTRDRDILSLMYQMEKLLAHSREV